MTEFRSGFVCFVGRPNTGKSTLTNAMVGTKVAITSSRPQTTRSTIRGMVNRPDLQLVLVDTPGLHRPRTLLGQRLNDLVRDTYSEVDVICLTIPADERIGPGDRYILEQVRHMAPKTPLLGVVTKIDKVGKQQVAEQLLAVSEFLGSDADVIPVSARSGAQVEDLVQLLGSRMQPGPAFYPDDEITDTDDDTMMAELIREAALEGVRDELPHSLAVVIEEVIERDRTDAQEKAGRPPTLEVHALLYVERPSQKAIVIGKGGGRLKEVGTNARQEIEKLLGRKIFLSLHVKVAKDWQRDPKQLGRLGF
ncbi:GTPase Era [Tsukamurella sp. 8F]|uniref:GTPase Era n=1 Tax=unclassified Tsukamurella TaxID=2633480 RepID=UPI0023B91B24|nr:MULTISPECIES: GTPase Era [unclassified Tsukamurella]MDF0530013.1 GTPase Era [Tsukamurella sp. 8J]MDF0587215.1 GTPase Era [Tsukamurella sp. 8F]